MGFSQNELPHQSTWSLEAMDEVQSGHERIRLGQALRLQLDEETVFFFLIVVRRQDCTQSPLGHMANL